MSEIVSPYDIAVERNGFLVKFSYDGEVIAFGELRHELTEESIQEAILMKCLELSFQLTIANAVNEDDEQDDQMSTIPDGIYPFDL